MHEWVAISWCIGCNIRGCFEQYLGVGLANYGCVGGNIYVCGGQYLGLLMAISGCVVAITG